MDSLVLTGSIVISVMSAVMLFCLFYTDIKAEKKQFKWYFYLPSLIVNTALGSVLPYLLIYIIVNSFYILFILYIIILVGFNLGLILKFRSDENFSTKFYTANMLVSLTALAFWVIMILV